MSLPTEIRSNDSAILATSAGERNGRLRTRVATAMCSVAAAIQVSMVHVSNVGWLPDGWSDADTKSNPSVSAARAWPIGSASGAADVEMLSPNINGCMLLL